MQRLLAFILFGIALGMCPGGAEAYQPKVIGTPDQHDVLPIAAPEIAHTIYGELINHPHTFEIVSAEPLHLFLEILVPDTKAAQDNVSGIVLEMLEHGSVREVARIHATDADWQSFYEARSGDSYRRGPHFETDLPPGTYRIEVSTPDNIGKYALVVGRGDGGEGMGYFETIREIARVKVFLGKSQFAIVESPFVYVPLLGLVIMILAGRLIRRRMKGI